MNRADFALHAGLLVGLLLARGLRRRGAGGRRGGRCSCCLDLQRPQRLLLVELRLMRTIHSVLYSYCTTYSTPPELMVLQLRTNVRNESAAVNHRDTYCTVHTLYMCQMRSEGKRFSTVPEDARRRAAGRAARDPSGRFAL